jgi:WD repeat-containing protein 19
LFDALGRRCLQSLEFDVAIRAFQHADNLSMVLTIQGFKEESEKNILLGNVAMILGEYDLAQVKKYLVFFVRGLLFLFFFFRIFF